MPEQDDADLTGQTLTAGLVLGSSLAIACVAVTTLILVAVFLAAGSILGWLFGGGAPTGEGSVTAPGSEIAFWTPTPIPNNCFVTPTPVAVTVIPQPLPTLDPNGTPAPTATAATVFLPTPTACPPPPNNWPTPDPRWTPSPPGYGPHGSPFRAEYVFTQAYGCTDFPEFRDQACNLASGGRTPWFHRGVDMVSLGNKTVYSTTEGQVEYAGWASDGFGIRVYVRAGEFLVIFPHLSQALVAAGQVVRWGQPVGIEGSTGYSTGSHLHYEIHINGAWVDSTPYLYR